MTEIFFFFDFCYKYDFEFYPKRGIKYTIEIENTKKNLSSTREVLKDLLLFRNRDILN